MIAALDDALQDVCALLLIDHLDLSHITLSCSPSTLDEEQLISSGRHEWSSQQAIANFPSIESARYSQERSTTDETCMAFRFQDRIPRYFQLSGANKAVAA